MKYFIPIFSLILISSCASIDTSRIAPGYVEAFKNIKQFITGVENEIKPEVIKNIPYASMLVKIGNGPTALMILESKNNEDYTWVSADGVYLVINNGKIIKTSGLNNNLKERLSASNTWHEAIDPKKEFVSYYTFSMPTLNNLKVTYTHSLKEIDNIELLFDTKKLQLIEEEISSNKVGWFRTNKYWVDDSNFVWKSVQNISPRLPEIYFEITKKPL